MQPRIEFENGELHLHCSFMEKELAKSVPGYKWDKQSKCWAYPVRADVLKELRATFPGAAVSAQAWAAVQEVLDREAAVAMAKDAGWENATPIEPMPLKTKPFKHQIQGYNIVCQLLGVFKQ